MRCLIFWQVFLLGSAAGRQCSALARPAAFTVGLSTRAIPQPEPRKNTGVSVVPRRPLISCLMSLSSGEDVEKDYSDDCFGLIFLSGALALGDAVFAGTFLILSTIAAISVKTRTLQKGDTQLPAAVAGLTLLATPLATLSLGESGIYSSLPQIDQAPLVEIGLCSFSMIYGFFWKGGNANV
jgi:hypothetical protein